MTKTITTKNGSYTLSTYRSADGQWRVIGEFIGVDGYSEDGRLADAGFTTPKAAMLDAAVTLYHKLKSQGLQLTVGA